MSWDSIIAISAVLIFLGKFVDWLLRKKQKELLLNKLALIEEYIKTISFLKWVQLVAAKVLTAYEFIHEIILGERGYSFLQGYFKPVILFLLVGVILELIAESYGLNKYGLSTPYLMCAFSGLIFHFLGKTSNRLAAFFPYVFRLILISSVFSSIALAVGSNLSSQMETTYWFIEDVDGDRYDKSSLLALINIPFDFVTIILSIFFLKIIVSKPKFVVPSAMFDIAASLLLTLGLYVTIDYVSSEGSLMGSADNSVTWLLSIIGVVNSSIGVEELMLTPLLLTTMIPVVVYMGAILGILLLLKPLTITSGYLCGLLSEKKNSPFMELATVLALFITMLKAVDEWGAAANILKKFIV